MKRLLVTVLLLLLLTHGACKKAMARNPFWMHQKKMWQTTASDTRLVVGNASRYSLPQRNKFLPLELRRVCTLKAFYGKCREWMFAALVDRRWRDSHATAHSGAPEDKHECPSLIRQGDAAPRSGLSYIPVKKALMPFAYYFLSSLTSRFAFLWKNDTQVHAEV